MELKMIEIWRKIPSGSYYQNVVVNPPDVLHFRKLELTCFTKNFVTFNLLWYDVIMQYL